MQNHVRIQYFRTVISIILAVCVISVYSTFNFEQKLESVHSAISKVEHSQSEQESSISAMQSELDALSAEDKNLRLALVELVKIYIANNDIDLFSNQESLLAEMYERTKQAQEKLYADDNRTNFYGRLYIPDAKIDVALYSSSEQYVTDRSDSANIFTWGGHSGYIIADHNIQEFHKLFSVHVGTEAFIKLNDGDIINLHCVDVLNGHNTGIELTDEDYVSVHGKADYIMYTCKNGWKNILVCLWEEY